MILMDSVLSDAVAVVVKESTFLFFLFSEILLRPQICPSHSLKKHDF